MLPTGRLSSDCSRGVTVTFAGGEGTALLRGDFSHWDPGPGGRIALSMRVKQTPAPSGFQSVHVEYAEFVVASLTWVR